MSYPLMQASPLGKQPDYETASIFDASPATTAATYEEYLCAYVDYIELIAAVSRCRTQRRIDKFADVRQRIRERSGITNLPRGMRPDDKIRFRFSVKGDEVLMDKPDFTRGGIIGALSRAADAVGISTWLPKKQAEQILRGYAETVTGKGWDDVANHIIANAALKFAKLK